MLAAVSSPDRDDTPPRPEPALGSPRSGGRAASVSARFGEYDDLGEATEDEAWAVRQGGGNVGPHSGSAGPTARFDPWIGKSLLERYRLERLIGKGGMGRVYRATQIPLNRPVAVKILSAEFQRKDPQFVRRFYLEAASAARLTHPHTITVFDYGEAEGGQLFIVMEHLKGRSLSKALAQDGPFSALRTLHVAIQICRALREAHAKGIIHRDLKPGNIMLLTEGDDADFVKVLDFGLVKLFVPAGGAPPRSPTDPGVLQDPEDEGDLTGSGIFLGSPKYMSPEQIQGHPLDPRTDIYSLGVIMYQMLTGRAPYSGASSVEVIYRHVNDPVPDASAFGAGVPTELTELVRRCLAKAPEDRHASMADLLIRLKDVRRAISGATGDLGYDSMMNSFPGSASAAPPAAFTAPAVGSESGVWAPRRSPWPSWLAAGLGAAIMSGLGFWWMQRPQAEPAAPAADPPAQVATAQVRLRSTPEGAEVFLDGEPRGQTPLNLQLRPSAVLRRFVFRYPGFQEQVEEVLVTEGETQIEALLRAEGADAPAEDGSQSPSDYKTNPY